MKGLLNALPRRERSLSSPRLGLRDGEGVIYINWCIFDVHILITCIQGETKIKG